MSLALFSLPTVHMGGRALEHRAKSASSFPLAGVLCTARYPTITIYGRKNF